MVKSLILCKVKILFLIYAFPLFTFIMIFFLLRKFSIYFVDVSNFVLSLDFSFHLDRVLAEIQKMTILRLVLQAFEYSFNLNYHV